MTASHDMFWSPEFGLRFQRTEAGVLLVGDWIEARRKQETLLDLNPNIILLLEVNMRGTDSLTHSDGFFLYTMGVEWEEQHPHDDFFWNYPYKHTNWDYWNQHTNSHDTFLHAHGGAHYWYDFWDADLGQPVGEKAQRYEGIEGLFIREFTNGWVIHNRSGKEQIVQLPVKSNGIESGITVIEHTISDLDGEIYLKATTGEVADINGDGVVNILDLVIVANAFGKDTPDVNGDGTVNVLDLVAVTNAFE